MQFVLVFLDVILVVVLSSTAVYKDPVQVAVSVLGLQISLVSLLMEIFW